MNTGFVTAINNPGDALFELIERLQASSCRNGESGGRFVLAVGSTATSDLPGISAAGASPELRRLTPRIDAEILALGRTVDGMSLPVSPAGIVSPVVITRAALGLMRMPVSIVDCGSFNPPGISDASVGSKVARCLSTGNALDIADVEMLFQAGLQVGQGLHRDADYAIVGECVPGGTTTALGVLTALGYQVHGLLSGSLPHPDHMLKRRLVDEGLSKAFLSQRAVADEPLRAVAAVGDPVQPVVAGIALGASRKIPIVLAGGSQMLAIWALIQELARAEGWPVEPGSIAVVTTKWVAFDQSADPARLASLLAAPFAAACPDFRKSRHAGLQAYEDGNVKEGVGAGGAMAVAHLTGCATADQILDATDRTYDELVATPGQL